MLLIFACVTVISLTLVYKNVYGAPYSYGYESREELVIGNVTSYDHFESGRGVLEWESITIGTRNYAVGLMDTGITIFTAEMSSNGSLLFRNVTDLPGRFIDVELIKHWNATSRTYEPVVVLVTGTYILEWYTISNDLKLEKIWLWDIHKPIRHISVFYFENMYHLLIMEEQPYFIADIYRFILDEEHGKTFWFSQNLPLEHTSKSSTFTAQESNYFLSIPQNNKVCIFKYDNNLFVSFANISSPGVDLVDSFNIGFKSYLLMNGGNAGIYEIHNYGTTKADVENAQMNGINYWLTIKITTFKDEIILLAQRILDHGDYMSPKLEVILFSGEKFYVHDEIPCNYYGEALSGIDCLVEEENLNSTINGSAVLYLDRKLGIVIPRRDSASGIALLSVNTRRIPNPIGKQMVELNAWKNKLEQMMAKRLESINLIEERLRTAKKPAITSSSEKNKSPSYEHQRLATARYGDGNSLSDIESKVEEVQRRLNNIKNVLRKAVRRDTKTIKVDTLVLNDIALVKKESSIKDIKVTTINNTKADALFNDFVRDSDDKQITRKKIFTNLHVESLNAVTINNQSVNNMVFKSTSETLHLKGDRIFTNTAEVQGNVTTTTGRINGTMDLSKVLMTDEGCEDEVAFKNVVANTLEAKIINKLEISDDHIPITLVGAPADVTYDILYMPGNVTIENINGEKFQDILESLCMRNQETTIPGRIIIDGSVNASADVKTKYLNGVKFPEEYVFQDEESKNHFIEFLGAKFVSEITAEELNVLGTINRVNTKTIITLTESQNIPGMITFTDFNPVGLFDVQGNISGLLNDKPNPTIYETKVIRSNVTFESLEVEGRLIIGNLINGTHLEQVLDEIVLHGDENVVITSAKDFRKGLTVQKGVEVTSNEINRIPLGSFIDKTSEQVLNVRVLNGNVTFENIFISGDFGGINLTQFNEETVKVNGEQLISATLNFINKISVNGDFKVDEQLNDVTPDSYVYKTGDRSLPNLNRLSKVEASTLTLEGDLSGKVDNFDIKAFNDNRLSLTKDQRVTETYIIKQLEVRELDARIVNDYAYADLINPERYKVLLENMIFDNKILIKALDIVGNSSIQSINGILMEDIMRTCSYQGQNQLSPAIIFEDDVEFARISIENLNGVPFDGFMANIVFKNETNVALSGNRLFESGFEVSGFIEASTVNRVPVEHVLRKTGNQKIAGPLIIKGNVTLQSDAFIQESLNDVSMPYLAEVIKVIDDNIYKINGEVIFDEQVYIDNLVINQFLNGKNLSKFLSEIIRVNDDVVIPGNTHFTNKVHIKNNLGVMEDINDVALSNLIDDIVFVTYGTYIQGLVTFAKPVYVIKQVIAETDLWCETIMGVDIREWWNKAVFVNKGVIEGELHFDSVTISEFVKTDFINSVNMSTLVPLRISQRIPEGFYIKEMSVIREISVDNLVNGINLELEFANTVLSEGNQEISSEVVFSDNVVVYENLKTTGQVNSGNLSRIVTTNTDQNLTAIYNFQNQTVMSSDLQVHGMVNNIDISGWNAEALRKRSDHIQSINGVLDVDQNVTFENDVTGLGSIFDLDFEDIVNVVRDRNAFKYTQEGQLQHGYSSTCDRVNQLLDVAKSQIYKFKYFDHLQVIEFENDIGIVHHFESEGFHYMLVNEINSCKSHLFRWSVSGYIRIKKDIETGMVLQFISVRDKNDSLYLIGRSVVKETPCSIEGTNVWKFESMNEMLHINKLESLSLLQDSKIPGTFYGFTAEYVYEFNVISYPVTHLRILRKWKLDNTENLAFMPHNLGTGLALRDGQAIYTLLKEGITSSEVYDFDTEETTLENIIDKSNNFIPGLTDGDFVVFNVGKPGVRTMSAVVDREESIIKGNFDVIKIYEDILHGKLFQKISSYKPSSLVAMEFRENGETLLIFLEDERVIQVYEYKGLEGFKLRSSIKREGQMLFLMALPLPPQNKVGNALAVINLNKLTLLSAIMDGNFIEQEYLKCSL